MDLALLFGILGSAFGFLVTYLLVIKLIRQPSSAYLMLAILIFSLSWVLMISLLNVSGWINGFPHLFRTELPFMYSLAPAFYLYICTFIHKEKKMSRYDFLHFLPAMIVFADLLPFLLMSGTEKIEIIQHYIAEPNSILSGHEGVLPLHLLFWAVGFYTLFYILMLSVNFSFELEYTRPHLIRTISDKELKWIISLAVCLILIALSFLWAVAVKPQLPDAYSIYATGYSLIFTCFIFLLFHRPEILYSIDMPPQDEAPKHNCLPLPGDQMKIYCDELLQFLNTERPYLTPGYTMDNLAKELHLTKNQLSFVINKGLGMKYNDLMNRSRIEYLVQYYDEVNNKNLTIEGMANNVGFNSRTTFLHSVKKFTGLTPTELVKRIEAKQYEN
ncbi:helix-turn-helix domain-containing protein [Catalinimonas sp. 4WD22]|uniref:helix-turn-helix domain-containing protein n=1 Tax=Catalinimonas locisalis TaxID=3133978 RepID=UPI003100FE24